MADQSQNQHKIDVNFGQVYHFVCRGEQLIPTGPAFLKCALIGFNEIVNRLLQTKNGSAFLRLAPGSSTQLSNKKLTMLSFLFKTLYDSPGGLFPHCNLYYREKQLLQRA